MQVYFWGVTAEAAGTEMLEMNFSGRLSELKENLSCFPQWDTLKSFLDDLIKFQLLVIHF